MKIAYRLRRTTEVRPTRALLIPGRDGTAILRLCARLSIDTPRLFAVADGMLLHLDRSLDQPMAGVIRLGELAPNLLLPVEAELIPALLDDEAQALGQRRGLIFLPAGRVLEFAPTQPITLATLVTTAGIERGGWHTLPPGPALAPRISEITYHRPDDQPDAILEVGGQGIGEEEPRPEDASLPSKILGKSALGLGKGIRWLGNALNLNMLADLGGKLMASGLSLVPRMSEQIMGKQEAGLRELLEAFRKGDIENALRRALPLGGSGSRGGSPHQGAQLPSHTLRYSLGNILGGWGPASLWYTPDQLYFELQREYRKQAEAAVQRGDYRRAAFIYGKLLSDYQMAATVLAQGGLPHDAAIIYLKRLRNYVAAARAFEAAGEFDEALALYRQCHEHIPAGDLLRRLGDEERAIAEYTRGADRLVEQSQAYCQAGELMLNKAQRADLAAKYFTVGWQARPAGSAVSCALLLAELHARSADGIALVRLTEEAQEFFQAPGNDMLASNYCNRVTQLADEPALAPVQEELRDRCLMTLAHKLRQASDKSPTVAPELFGPWTVWEAPLIDDANYAARQQRRSIRADAVVSTIAIPARTPIVRAVCQAPRTGELFVGFSSGEIACFHPGRGDVQLVGDQPFAIQHLAVNDSGDELAVMCTVNVPDGNHFWIAAYTRTRSVPWQQIESRVLDQGECYWLCTPLVRAHDSFALLFETNGNSEDLQFLRLPRLLPAGSIRLKECWPCAAIPMWLRESREGMTQFGAIIFFDGHNMVYVAFDGDGTKESRRVPCGLPGQLQSSSLSVTPLSWMSVGPARIEVVGVGSEGALTWLDLTFDLGEMTNTVSRSAPGPYRAAAILRSGVIAAVAADHIVWLRAGPTGIREQLSQRISLADPIACFAYPTTQELLILSGNGLISRVRQAI